MEPQDILTAIRFGEEKDWEFKGARGGLPSSLWETYSAMANTDGGVIVLGVKQHDGTFHPEGLADPAKLKQDFWNLVNNRQKVNLNLLTNEDVTVEDLGGRSVVAIRIPRATRRQRPIYVGMNPLDGTYRRFQEGDYKCSPDEVGRMLADQAEEPADSHILDHFGLDDLDGKSVQQNRNRFSARSPTHPWLAQDERGLLEKLGAWRTDRATGKAGLTVAGLLMFGKDEAIRDPHALPNYQVDYRERLSEDPGVRWSDRLTIDGTWVGNLFQFYQDVIGRLYRGLKVPFGYQNRTEPGLYRKDETIVHEAIREALVNALIHADYRGMGGVVIEKYRGRIELSNPGSLLLSVEQLLKGGVSECRNKSLQQMFQQIGGGEKAGSGIDKIRQGWASQNWRYPLISEQTRPDRVRVVLPMLSLLPEESLERLRRRFGGDFALLGPDEVQALVTADIEGDVSNLRLRQFSLKHSAEITKTLQALVAKGFLRKDGHGRWASYSLPAGPAPGTGDSSHKAGDSSPSGGDSSHRAADSSHTSGDSSHRSGGDTGAGETPQSSNPSINIRRKPPAETRRIILELCEGRYLTAAELAAHLGRRKDKLRERFLTKMVAESLLLYRHPEEPNRPDQAYTTNR